MCSQTPDTTSPMAKPDTPDVRPPKKAAMRKSTRFSPSIVVAPEAKGTQRLDECHLTGGGIVPGLRRMALTRSHVHKQQRSPPLSEETVLGLACLENAGRPPLAPRRCLYYRSFGRTRLYALHTRIFVTRHGALSSLILLREAAMTNKIDLSGRNAVVTGGAQGIGRAIVERFIDLEQPSQSGTAISRWQKDSD